MAGTGGAMMAGPLTQGTAQSGFGVQMGGFYCHSRDIQGQIENLVALIGGLNDFATQEQEAYITFLGFRNERELDPALPKTIAFFRREPYKFFTDLSPFLRSLRARYVLKAELIGSMGSIQLILHYQPMPQDDVV